MSKILESEFFSVRPVEFRQFHIFDMEDVNWMVRNGREVFSRNYISKDMETLVVNIKGSLGEFDYIRCSAIEFVSDRVVDVFSEKINAEYIKFIALGGAMMVRDVGYSMFHLLDRFDAVDLVRSDVVMHSSGMGGGIKSINRLFLDWDVVGDSQAFFLEDAGFTCISKKLRDDLLRVGVTGFDFLSLDKIDRNFS